MKEHSADSPYEEKVIRCPKLGGPITFNYCKMESGARPCSRALTCWAGYFHVESHFRQILTPEEFHACFEMPPASRVTTLLELVERARKLTEPDTKSNS